MRVSATSTPDTMMRAAPMKMYTHNAGGFGFHWPGARSDEERSGSMDTMVRQSGLLVESMCGERPARHVRLPLAKAAWEAYHQFRLNYRPRRKEGYEILVFLCQPCVLSENGTWF